VTALVIVAVAVVVVLVLVVLVARRSRRADGVADFRRQIDALSHEARRPVVGQVQQLEEEAARSSAPREDDDEQGPT
jgi:hypothetical protein